MQTAVDAGQLAGMVKDKKSLCAPNPPAGFRALRT